MSSISVKVFKIIIRFIRFIPLLLPALALPILAARWQPAPDAGEFPGAAFHSETVSGYPEFIRGEPPKPETVTERPHPDLPADLPPPGEVARAFYRRAPENAKPGPAAVPYSGLPQNKAPPEEGREAEAAVKAAEPENTGGEERQLLGFIRDAAGIEHRYFKEKESGRIIAITNRPETSPDNPAATETER
jgi:hypothetical protein